MRRLCDALTLIRCIRLSKRPCSPSARSSLRARWLLPLRQHHPWRPTPRRRHRSTRQKPARGKSTRERRVAGRTGRSPRRPPPSSFSPRADSHAHVRDKFTHVTLDEFRATLSDPEPPAVSPPLVALWYDARGDWERAHNVAQDVDDRDGSWVHAYLHRKEGDLGNADYWYRRARFTLATDSLDAEWERIVSDLLARL